MSLSRIGVLTSGGDAPAMNAAIRAVVREALSKGLSVVGVYRGYEGLIQGDIRELDSRSVGDIIQRAGTILRSARSQEFRTGEGQRKAVSQLRSHGIEGLVVIGGDGSFRGAMVLHGMGILVVGIPASIDNDIACTDYCIGFDTAANTALDAINKIRDTASSHGRINVIEVMGRNSGFLALTAGLAGGADSILIPEVEYDLDAICRSIKDGYERGKTHNIIVVAEGLEGHPCSGSLAPESIGFKIGNLVMAKTGYETRVTVLGHVQRGGSPTVRDRILATRLGARAVDLLCEGKSGQMVGVAGEEVVSASIEDAVRERKPVNLDCYRLARVLSEV